jgi:hypothetical protein
MAAMAALAASSDRVPRQDWVQSALVCYLAGLPTGQVWTGSPVPAQWR